VGLLDAGDNSTEWRREVWREAFSVLISKPRHLLVGVGMDSVKRRAHEWGMFDHGKLPPGHMHNTYLQFAFERGVPALLLWLWVLFVYFRLLWRAARSDLADWRERGLMLGALGGAVGFCVSGLVHYNYGDSEVLMVFYCVMGLVLACLQVGERRLRVVDGGRG
jgi:putative inorganic carbon (hco3(-)) transporter